MTSRIAGDPERLRQTGAQMAGLADEIGEARHRLAAALESEGRCWGADEAGLAFEAAYLAASRDVRSVLAAVEGGVYGIADKLALLTDLLETADHDAAWVLG